MKKINIKLLSLLTLLIISQMAWGQAPENWFNLDYKKDGVRGVSTEKVYKELIGDRTSTTVIVAVIDGGVDIDHEDLQGKIWVNTDEIPDNGIDDDKNGYVDDIHGWNFLGGKNGESVNNETLEITRLYRHYHAKFKDKDISKLSKKDKKEYDLYLECKEVIDEQQAQSKAQAAQFEMVMTRYNEAIEKAEELLGDNELNAAFIETLDSDDESNAMAITLLEGAVEEGMGFDEFSGEVQKELENYKNYMAGQAGYYYNPDFNPRAEIVQDDYNNSYEKGYGNNDVEGPDAGHGTHVAGIIAADRNNDLGMKGVCEDVKIMCLRAVPNGDEHDKDVANAIIYAVDNGATVINMSFGKGYSWDKTAVDKAVKYAQDNDVLMVHAAGNDGKNNDDSPSFPNDAFKHKQKSKKLTKCWIEVGAMSWMDGDDLTARFSNYGKKGVDVFSPGVDVYSTVPEKDAYAAFNGTSMASPVTAGVAALLRSYFPELTAVQVKEILLESSVPISHDVTIPGGSKKVKLSDISTTGGVVNAYNAFKLAMKTKGKKKINKGV